MCTFYPAETLRYLGVVWLTCVELVGVNSTLHTFDWSNVLLKVNIYSENALNTHYIKCLINQFYGGMNL